LTFSFCFISFFYRSIQVFAQHKQTHADLLASQRSLNGGNSLGGPLRFKDVVIFWLQCDGNGIICIIFIICALFTLFTLFFFVLIVVLNERIDTRVDDMVAAGLIDELLSFHNETAEKYLFSFINLHIILISFFSKEITVYTGHIPVDWI